MYATRTPVGDGDSDRELRDRSGLIDHQRRRAVLRGAVDHGGDVVLVVAKRPGEESVAGVVEPVGQVLFLADIQPNPDGHVVGSCSHVPPPNWRPWEGRPRARTPASTLRTSDRAHVPVSEPACPTAPGQHPPSPRRAGAENHAETTGLPTPASFTRAHGQGKGGTSPLSSQGPRWPASWRPWSRKTSSMTGATSNTSSIIMPAVATARSRCAPN